jgi:hypothetical protein
MFVNAENIVRYLENGMSTVLWNCVPVLWPSKSKREHPRWPHRSQEINSEFDGHASVLSRNRARVARSWVIVRFCSSQVKGTAAQTPLLSSLVWSGCNKHVSSSKIACLQVIIKGFTHTRTEVCYMSADMSENPTVSINNAIDGCSRVFWNVGTYPTDYTASHDRIQQFSESPPVESENPQPLNICHQTNFTRHIDFF